MLGVAVADRVLRRRYDGRVLPPARLRYKVRGSASGDAFARIGRACATDIDAALRSCGHSVAQSRRILDFGCGCGGTLLWLTDLAPTASISGTDIDASAIEWCGANIPFAKFAVNGALPPLAYADASFDLVYAVSVFTHLDEDYQFRWLAELERIIVPGGVCVVTLAGPGSWNEMPVSDRQMLADRGFVYIRDEATSGLFPELVPGRLSLALLRRGELFTLLRHHRIRRAGIGRASGCRRTAETPRTVLIHATQRCIRRCPLADQRLLNYSPTTRLGCQSKVLPESFSTRMIGHLSQVPHTIPVSLS